MKQIFSLLFLVFFFGLWSAQSCVFAQKTNSPDSLWAGPWILWNRSTRIDIKVSGENLSADWELEEGVFHSVYSLQATVNGNGRTAGGTLIIKRGQNPQLVFTVDLYLSPSGRGIAMAERSTSPRINTSISRPNDWKPGEEKEELNILSYSYQLGNELPFTDSKPVALRISIKVTDDYRAKYSIASVEFVPQVFSEGATRFAPAIDTTDAFNVYTGASGILLVPPANVKEANFEFPSVDYGLKLGSLSFPKEFTVSFKVKLKSSAGEQVEKLEVPVRINTLFTVGVQSCGQNTSAGCPRFKGKRLAAGEKANGLFGDELVIPMDARLWVKFLDGSVGYFVNQTDVEWNLTMGFGRFKTTQGGDYTENKLEIKAVISQALESGVGKATDKTAEAALEMILRRTASQSAPGLILQLIEFFGGTRIGGDFVAVRLRSEVGISLRKNGEIIVRNFEGNPEILQDNMAAPVPIPQGYQVKKPKGLPFGKAERYSESDPAVTIWNNKTNTDISRNADSSNSKILDAVLPGSLAKWSGVYNPPDKNPVFSYEEIPLGASATAIRTRAVGNTLASCESKWIKRIYDTGFQNSRDAVLEITADFSFNGTTYNLPSIRVELLDDNERSLGNKQFFGKNIIGSFNRSKLQSTGYIELPSATGTHQISLNQIGANINFSKLAIYLTNYTCQGENSIVFKRLEIKSPPTVNSTKDASTLKNLALNRPAQQSSTSEWSKPNDSQGAVDGVKNGSFGFHTNQEKNPWWQVDLGEVKQLTEIRIFNRLDYNPERARTIQVLLSNDGVNWTRVFANDGSIFGGADGKRLNVPLTGKFARFVRLQLYETNYFHLDEVEIY